MLALRSGIDDSIFTLEYADSIPPLSKAAAAGDLEEVRKFISRGSLPQVPDNRGWTSIHCCVAANQTKSLKLILKLKAKNKKHLVNLKTWDNITPLLIALKPSKPSLEIVKLLLEAGADPKQCTSTRLSPLHLACLNKGNIDCVKLLVQFGANVNVQEELGLITPLHFAISEAHDLEVVEFLSNLCDLSLGNIFNRTPFLEACNSNFLEAVQLFLEKDESLANFKSDLPPLVYAGVLGNLEMAQLLIKSGADVNFRCKAVARHMTSDSDLILFDRRSFLPVHSSLKNLDVFALLLNLTEHNTLLELETNYYSFPLFVMIYADETIYEYLLQSELPDKLKTIGNQVLVKFILSYPDMEEIVIQKFPKIFKYNFSLSPENVFQRFAEQIGENELCKSIRYLHLLSRLGISSGTDMFQYKNNIISLLESFMTGEKDVQDLILFRSTCDLLSVSVLTLKQLCRITFRSHIKSATENDWLALKMVMQLNVPEDIKNFLIFESLI